MRQYSILTGILACLSVFTQVNCGGGQGLPNKWWTNTRGKPVYSLDEFKDLINGDLKDKHVFVDFYMQ